MKRFAVSLVCFCLFFSFAGCVNSKEEEVMVETGKKVAFDYTLKVDGQVVDSSKERGPLTYVHGQGQIIPGLSKELEGMKVGDEKNVTVAPKDAYGELKPDAFQEISRSVLPKDVEIKPGMILQAKGPEGQAIPVKVKSVEGDKVTIDFNHPMAGKTLNFDVKIVSIE